MGDDRTAHDLAVEAQRQPDIDWPIWRPIFGGHCPTVKDLEKLGWFTWLNRATAAAKVPCDTEPFRVPKRMDEMTAEDYRRGARKVIDQGRIFGWT